MLPVLQVALMPSYYTLGSIGRDKARSRPLYSITEDQKHAAEEFLRVSCRPATSLIPLDRLAAVSRFSPILPASCC